MGFEYMFALQRAIRKRFKSLKDDAVSLVDYKRDWNGKEYEGDFCYVCRNRECVATCNCPKCYQEFLEDEK